MADLTLKNINLSLALQQARLCIDTLTNAHENSFITELDLSDCLAFLDAIIDAIKEQLQEKYSELHEMADNTLIRYHNGDKRQARELFNGMCKLYEDRLAFFALMSRAPEWLTIDDYDEYEKMEAIRDITSLGM